MARAAGRQDYLDLAVSLRPLLDDIDGVIFIGRVSRLSEPGKLLSLSILRDEAAPSDSRLRHEAQPLAASGARRSA